MSVRCVDCGNKFLVDAQHVVNGLSCDNCGSERMERDQPSPTKSDGELRDMPRPGWDDPGGNPLGEGTIMGSDGERPWFKRDNFMHGKVANVENWLPGNHFRNSDGGIVRVMTPLDRFTGLIGLQHVAPEQPWDGKDFHIHRDDIDRYGYQPYTPTEELADKVRTRELRKTRPLLEHPDPWMDNEPGTMTFPEHWVGKVANDEEEIPQPIRFEDLYHVDENGQMVSPPQPPPAFAPGSRIRVHTPEDPKIHGQEGTYLRADPNYQGAHFVKLDNHSANWLTTGMLMPAVGEADPTWNEFWHGAKTAMAPEDLLRSEMWPKAQPMVCPHCHDAMIPQLGMCPLCGEELNPEHVYHREQLAKTAVHDGIFEGFQQVASGNSPGSAAAAPVVELIWPDGEVLRGTVTGLQHTPNGGKKIRVTESNGDSSTYLIDGEWPKARFISGNPQEQILPERTAAPRYPRMLCPNCSGTKVDAIGHPCISCEGVGSIPTMGGGDMPPGHNFEIGPGPKWIQPQEWGTVFPDLMKTNEDRTSSMEPYLPWAYQDPRIPLKSGFAKTAGPAAALMGLGGAVGGEGLLGMAAPALMRGALFGAGSNMIGDMSGGGSMPPQQQQMLNPLPLSSVKQADLETPSSVPEIGLEHDDPESVDQHEFNDGDTDPNPYNPEIPGEAGGIDSVEDGVKENAGFAPDSAGIQRMQLLGPLVMHYLNSDQSGANEPLLRELHNTLEEENPGYLDKVGPEHEHALQQLLDQIRNPQVTAAAPIGMPVSTGTPMMPPGTAPNPMGQRNCPLCGAVTDPTGACPQCRANVHPQQNQALMNQQPGIVPPGQQMPYASKVAQGDPSQEIPTDGIDPNQQGPKTPEQIAAVQQLLMEMGREAEVPLVPLQPSNYARELAEIQQKPNQPPNIDPSQAPMPPIEQTPPDAGMPMPAPPTGLQPMARVAEIAPGQVDVNAPGMARGRDGQIRINGVCPRCGADGFLVEDSQHGIGCNACGAHLAPKQAADSFAPRCPNCNSGTTGLTSEDGTCRCHACGNTWKRDVVKEKVGKLALDSTDTAIQDAPVDQQPPNDQTDADLEEGDDSSVTWQDTDGNPLQQGQTYEMHNPSYRIPDVVTINQVKPDGITVTTQGSTPTDPNSPALQYTHDISKQEIDTEGITFVPAGEADDGADAIDPMNDGDRVNTDPVPQSIERTTSVSDSECPQCGESQHITSSMSSPTSHMHECYRCGKAWETYESSVEGDDDPRRAWLMDSDLNDFDYNRFAEMRQAAGGQARSLSSIAAKDKRYQEVKNYLDQQKTAGKRFTLKEQQAFINEDGEARNLEDLDLTGTHYESLASIRGDMVGVGSSARTPDGSLVNDAHLVFGL